MNGNNRHKNNVDNILKLIAAAFCCCCCDQWLMDDYFDRLLNKFSRSLTNMLQHRAKSFIIDFKNDCEHMNTNRGHSRRLCLKHVRTLKFCKSNMSTVIEADTDEKISSLQELNAEYRPTLNEINKQLHFEKFSVRNRLLTIHDDHSFVSSIHSMHFSEFPLCANLRC